VQVATDVDGREEQELFLISVETKVGSTINSSGSVKKKHNNFGFPKRDPTNRAMYREHDRSCISGEEAFLFLYTA
jgi:hypothetical protein